jgi:hypothetical protein
MGKQPHNKHMLVFVITVLQRHSNFTRLKEPSFALRTPSAKHNSFREDNIRSSILVISLLSWGQKAHYHMTACIRAHHSILPWAISIQSIFPFCASICSWSILILLCCVRSFLPSHHIFQPKLWRPLLVYWCYIPSRFLLFICCAYKGIIYELFFV